MYGSFLHTAVFADNFYDKYIRPAPIFSPPPQKQRQNKTFLEMVVHAIVLISHNILTTYQHNVQRVLKSRISHHAGHHDFNKYDYLAISIYPLIEAQKSSSLNGKLSPHQQYHEKQ